MKVRSKSALVSLMLLGMLSACAQGNGGPEAVPSSAGSQGKVGSSVKRLKVGVSYQNLQNELVINIQNAIREKAKEQMSSC